MSDTYERLKALDERVHQLDNEITSLSNERLAASQEAVRIRSEEWVRVNKVRRADLLSCDDEGLPWFSHVTAFLHYVASLNPDCKRRFVAWNGVINFTDVALSNGFDHQSPGRVSEVKD